MFNPNLDRQVLGLFETPVMISRLSEAGQLNSELKTVILQRRQAGGGIARSNVLGWHSDTEMVHWGGPPAHTILEHMLRLCDGQTVDSQQVEGGPPRFRWAFEMWANVSSAGASNQMHAHPGAIWSAVYYVDDGYAGSRDRALGGELILHDPRFPMNKMYASDFTVKDAQGRLQKTEQALRPASGTMVVFPSWLMHSVRPYLGPGERISIAINLSLVSAKMIEA